MSDHSSDDAGGGLPENVPVVYGGLLGALAYLLAYALTYALVTVDSGLGPERATGPAVTGSELFELGFPRPEPSTFEFVGWILTNAHFTETVFAPDIATPAGGNGAGSLSVNFLSTVSTQVPSLVYHLVPVALLGASGYLLARRSPVSSLWDVVRTGGAVLIGYAPLSVLGGLVFATSQSGQQGGVEVTVTAGPQLGLLVVTAVAFPLVFGTAGGFLASPDQ